MKYILLLIFIQSIFFSFAQTDTNKIYNTQHYRKGFYRSYEEFINNSPSIIKDFKEVLYVVSDKDSTIVAADFKFDKHNKTTEYIWGFCDSNSVYINFDNGIFKNRYWKAEHLGQHSFFTYYYKRVVIGPLPITILTSLRDFESRMMVVNDKGKIKFPDAAFIRKQLASQPDLLKEFKEEWKPYEKFDYANADETESDESYKTKMEIVKKYLIMLDERLK